MRSKLACLTALALLACDRGADRDVAPVANRTPPSVPAPATGPNAKTPLAPVKIAADSKSTEAAEELARRFAQLLSERKLDEAYMLLGAGALPRKDFDRQLAGVKNLQASVGTPDQQEGAAGSIYIGIPLNISGNVGDEHVSWPAGLILRRVNDVPGSTEAQRRWHIERLNLNDKD